MMNNYQMMIEFEEQLKNITSRARDEQFRQEALAANRHRNRLGLMWLRNRFHQIHFPKISLPRPMSTIKHQR
jgi:hypothetical protein